MDMDVRMGVNYGMTGENLCHLRSVLRDQSHGCLGICIGPYREGEGNKDGVRLGGKRLFDFPARRPGLRDAEEVD